MRASVFLIACLALSCGGAGPYGYSRSYTPLDDEARAARDAREYDPVMVERSRAEWKKQPVSVFGVVTARKPGAGGAYYLTLSARSLADRNLCNNMQEDSCRVTVSEHQHGIVHAWVKLYPDDETGAMSVGVGSLLRLVGRLTDDVDPSDSAPVLKTVYYRHWPRNYYVTDAAREQMRR